MNFSKVGNFRDCPDFVLGVGNGLSVKIPQLPHRAVLILNLHSVLNANC